MIRLILKCKSCGEELEKSMPAINSTSDMVLIVKVCERCEISQDAYEEVMGELQDLQQLLAEKEQRIADLEAKIELELGGVA
jgi:hypothetical protein